jgi:hypothetical protein
MTYQPDPPLQPRIRTEFEQAPTQPLAGPTVVQAVAEPAVVEHEHQHVVVERPAPVAHQRVATSYRQRFSFDSVLVGIIGLALTIIGLVAVTRAGVDGPMSDPVVKVLGFTHTATLGAIETAFGVCLLLCAAMTARGGAAFFGVLLGIGAIVGAVQTASFRHSLALESGFAWLVAVAAAVVVLVSLLLPRMSTHTTRVDAY